MLIASDMDICLFITPDIYEAGADDDISRATAYGDAISMPAGNYFIIAMRMLLIEVGADDARAMRRSDDDLMLPIYRPTTLLKYGMTYYCGDIIARTKLFLPAEIIYGGPPRDMPNLYTPPLDTASLLPTIAATPLAIYRSAQLPVLLMRGGVAGSA